MQKQTLLILVNIRKINLNSLIYFFYLLMYFLLWNTVLNVKYISLIYFLLQLGWRLTVLNVTAWLTQGKSSIGNISVLLEFLLRCGDPFNYTLTIEDMPAIKKCEGCCVKLVQNIGTPLYSVRRTCTDHLGGHVISWQFP